MSCKVYWDELYKKIKRKNDTVASQEKEQIE
jgi:sRNA-binding carbon storage regulator CsrA